MSSDERAGTTPGSVSDEDEDCTSSDISVEASTDNSVELSMPTLGAALAAIEGLAVFGASSRII
jgi:hypothetical protein